MRSGGYTLQQSLTSEAATIVKQAVSLARRRGHAQVTPLHVASAMLSSSTGLLKRACFQFHSHPLQCKALELCFNVALNRLPTSASSPLLGPQSHFPSLSNALVAAFKRAQAHQRRGSIENQQQPILALKVEIEQLVISILDDPSVSRVMREAGFSSTQVKSNVEQVVSMEISNSKTLTTNESKEIITTKPSLIHTINNTTSSTHHQFRLSFSKSTNAIVQQTKIENDDVMSVLEAMMNNKTKNSVVIGECVSTAEGVIRGLIDKFDRKEVPSEMRSVQFISVPFFTLRNISRQEFEAKVGELRSLVKSYMNSGIVLYLGDLQWVSEFWSEQRNNNNSSYCTNHQVEYMMMELSRLVYGSSDENTRIWIMGIASFQTYAKCRRGRPCLETLWSLHPLTIPLGTLALSLSLDSNMHDEVKMEPVEDELNLLFDKFGIKKHLICCPDCFENFKREAQGIVNAKKEFFTTASNSSLPSWLQQYKDENRKQANMDKEIDKMKDLCKKWNSICSSVHKKPYFLEKGVFNLSSPISPSSSSSTSISSSNGQTLLNWPTIFEPTQTNKQPRIHLYHDQNTSTINISKPELLSNPNSSPNSASSSEASQELIDHFSHKFKDLNPDSLTILSHALEKKVPWQRDLIHEIATTVLECRSGTIPNKTKIKLQENREDTWLFFLGVDSDGKEAIARELAKAVFGSYDDFFPIRLSSFSSNPGDDSSDQEAVSKNKRSRDNENGGSCYERFVNALRDNPRKCFHVEDVDQVDDYRCLKAFERAIKDGFVRVCDGEQVLLKDAIVIFSCESFSPAWRPVTRRKLMEKENEEHDDDDEMMEKRTLDLNVATEDDDDDENSASCEIRILDLVDKQVVFKVQVL